MNDMPRNTDGHVGEDRVQVQVRGEHLLSELTEHASSPWLTEIHSASQAASYSPTQ